MISIQHVHKSFGKLPALNDVCLEIAPGERVAFVGSNGSGKTTLLRALLGLLRVQGRITIDGLDVAVHPQRALRHVAYVPQIAPPIDAPVGEVIVALAALRGIEPAAIEQRAERLGLSLAPIRPLRFRDLSGGMKQKLLAAAALAACTPVLVCDEPTANLDAAARQAFLAQLDERPGGSIVLLCSHRAEEVHKLVSRVVEMHEGRVLRDGAARTAALLESERVS